MAVTPTSLYRNVLREVRLTDSLHSFKQYRMQSSVLKHLRSLFEERLSAYKAAQRKASTADNPRSGTSAFANSNASIDASSMREMSELGQYLKARRLHQGLLERYNAGINMTQEERSRLTARRVGLDMPEEYVNKALKGEV